MISNKNEASVEIPSNVVDTVESLSSGSDEFDLESCLGESFVPHVMPITEPEPPQSSDFPTSIGNANIVTNGHRAAVARNDLFDRIIEEALKMLKDDALKEKTTKRKKEDKKQFMLNGVFVEVSEVKIDKENPNQIIIYCRCAKNRGPVKGGVRDKSQNCRFRCNVVITIDGDKRYREIRESKTEHCRIHTCKQCKPIAAGDAAAVIDIKDEMSEYIENLLFDGTIINAQKAAKDCFEHFKEKYEGHQIYPYTIPQLKKQFENKRSSVYGHWEGIIKSAPFKYTLNGTLNNDKQLFYQFDLTYKSSGGNKDIQRFIGWGHPELMAILKEPQRNIFADATFNCCPEIFKQCLILMVYDIPKDHYVPVFYVLMQEKTQDAYERVFEEMNKALEVKIDAATITCDFEVALLNALENKFGNEETNLICCFFHMKQAIRKKLVDLKLPFEIISMLVDGTNEGDRVEGLIDMLTVILPEEIETTGIPYIRNRMNVLEKHHKCEEIMDKFWKEYFVPTWIKRHKPSTWNIGKLVSGEDKDRKIAKIVNRTNNCVERYNKRMRNDVFNHPHPAMVEFVNGLRNEAQAQLEKVKDIASGCDEPNKHAPLTVSKIPDDYEKFKEVVELYIQQQSSAEAKKTYTCVYQGRRMTMTSMSGSKHKLEVETEELEEEEEEEVVEKPLKKKMKKTTSAVSKVLKQHQKKPNNPSIKSKPSSCKQNKTQSKEVKKIVSTPPVVYPKSKRRQPISSKGRPMRSCQSLYAKA